MKSDQGDRVRAGDRQTLEITTLLASGDGGSDRVRVAGAFPDERVVARIDYLGKHATFATAIEVERGRMGRRVPPCDQHRDVGGRCTGCGLMALREDDQRVILRDMLASEYGLEVDEVVAAPEQLGYRYSAKRIAFGGPGKLRLGSFVRGTHKPADMEGCLVDHPLIAAAADQVAREARDLGVAAHDETRKRRGLRAVWFRTNGEAVLTTLVTSEQDENELLQLASRMTLSNGVAFSLHSDDGNALRGDHSESIRGIESIEVDGAQVGPLGFLQPNPTVAHAMYEWLAVGVAGKVLELYSGSGASTQQLRAVGADVTPCESHPESAAKLGVTPETAEDFLKRQSATPDVVVANPPRKGLASAVTSELLRLKPPRIHIMACGPAGLAIDLAALKSAYRVESLRAFDTLPQTPHVEVIAKLVRL